MIPFSLFRAFISMPIEVLARTHRRCTRNQASTVGPNIDGPKFTAEFDRCQSILGFLGTQEQEGIVVLPLSLFLFMPSCPLVPSDLLGPWGKRA